MTSGKEFDEAYSQTKDVYVRRAAEFDRDRARDGRETPWLELFAQHLPVGGHVLDLGCGTGEPVARWLLEAGFEVTGADYSEPMLEIARRRFQKGTWMYQDMRDLTLTGSFDGIISWHGSFHLTQDEQRELIPKLAGLLNPGGALMLTIGPEEGEVTGTIAGETVYHASLDPSEYRALLADEGFSEIILPEVGQTEGPFILLARR